MIEEVLLQGLIYALVSMGMFLSSRLLRFNDLSVDGSFGLGGAVSALVLLSGGPGWLAVPLALLAGALVGCLTALMHLRLKIDGLIAGFCVTSALFSVNLALVGSNATLRGSSVGLGVLVPLVGAVFAVLWWFLRTEVGLMIAAAGENPLMVQTLGKRPERYKMLGLALSNSLTALAGALFVQLTGFFSITGSVGTLLVGLSGVIIGGLISRGFGIGLIVGAIAYQAVFGVTLSLGVPPLWNNAIKAGLIIALLALNLKRRVVDVRVAQH